MFEKENTGIFDRTGKEISEGDLIEADVTYGAKLKQVSFVVRYDPTVAAFVGKFLDTYYVQVCGEHGAESLALFFLSNIVITGSAYDTPEKAVPFCSRIFRTVDGVNQGIRIIAKYATDMPENPQEFLEKVYDGGDNRICEQSANSG